MQGISIQSGIGDFTYYVKLWEYKPILICQYLLVKSETFYIESNNFLSLDLCLPSKLIFFFVDLCAIVLSFKRTLRLQLNEAQF